jgi:hypothetical protein
MWTTIAPINHRSMIPAAMAAVQLEPKIPKAAARLLLVVAAIAVVTAARGQSIEK